MSHILVFDSGIGGTSVLSHLQTRVQHANFSYVMDNAYLPYGLQPQEVIKSRIKALIHWQEQCLGNVDLIIIACNTASTYALEEARKHTGLPIIGVVPAVKPAALSSRSRHIALLATPATSNNSYTHKLIADFTSGCKVETLHSTELVRIAERFYWHNALDQLALYKEIEQLHIPDSVDRLVLGCTHFPLIGEHIKTCLPPHMELVDSGEAIANRAVSLLASHETSIKKVPAKEVRFYATAPILDSKKEIALIDL
ncbi:glutamate racemase [Pseudoalteromonas piscicida]|uniref:Glutamate racemase n=1 Tax=Pseudoalteromonas piscicida TaxID=43662 RepID=A0A2A5JL69_PSEO7|nr:glutamate racemase [Pseudoalteromonas piscicida]PCK29991.1 glutamate racemase [Pseudoalteromonas piscicida]